MKPLLLALYAGPDQIMVTTSALATVLGFVLMLWGKLVRLFIKVWNHFRGAPQPEENSGSTDSRNAA
jgi:predicted cobalt transporter CbtA